jgi:hypothetical protein
LNNYDKKLLGGLLIAFGIFVVVLGTMGQILETLVAFGIMIAGLGAYLLFTSLKHAEKVRKIQEEER